MTEVINLPSIKRLALAGGAQHVSATLYQPARQIISEITSEVFSKCEIVAESAERKTIMYSDLEYVVQGMGERFYGSADTKYELCKNLDDMRSKKNCLYIGRTHFRKLVESFSSENFRLSAGFLDNFQHYVENKVIKYMSSAVELALMNKRVTVGGEHLEFVYKRGCSGSVVRAVARSPVKVKRSVKKSVKKSVKSVKKSVKK